MTNDERAHLTGSAGRFTVRLRAWKPGQPGCWPIGFSRFPSSARSLNSGLTDRVLAVDQDNRPRGRGLGALRARRALPRNLGGCQGVPARR